MLKLALACFVLLCGAAATEAAQSPCDALAANAFPAPDQPPVIEVWAASQTPADLPDCGGLPLADAKLAVMMRGSFRFAGSEDDLLTRIGAISSLRELRYWSTTEKKWLPLVKVAQALNAPEPDAARPDFGAAELRSGNARFYLQQDNRSSHPVVYRMNVRVTGRDSAVIDSENLTPVRWLLVTLFEPHALHSHVQLKRAAPGVWCIVQVDWIGPGASLLALGHEASYVNRTAALFRHLAGLPTDQDPPAAP